MIPIKYNNDNLVEIEVFGNSMDDGTKRSICAGDIAVCSELKVENDDRVIINKAYYILHPDFGNSIKEIINIDGLVLTCHSWNSEYPDYMIEFNDKVRIFKVIETRRKL